MNAMENQVPEKALDAGNMKGMVQKNSVEKLEFEKKQKTIEQQKKYFVRQHSRDENEIKQILQRLQHEQQIREPDSNTEFEFPEAYERGFDSEDEEERNGIVNPYPLIIVPRFGPPTPLKDADKTDPRQYLRRTGRRKSLEYEDINKSTTSKLNSSFKATLIAASFINKLHGPINNKKTPQLNEAGEESDLWVGDPEYISSIRRPRKSVAIQSHKKILRRAKSDIWPRPDSGMTYSSGLTVRAESGKLRNKSVDESGTDQNLSGFSTQKRKTSKESSLSVSGSFEASPGSSPLLSRKGSTNTRKEGEKDVEAMQRKSSLKGRKQGTVERPVLSQINDKREATRKASLKSKANPEPEQKDTMASETTEEENIDIPASTSGRGASISSRRKSSLKKKKSNEGTVPGSLMRENSLTNASLKDTSKKSGFTNTDSRTRHLSLKEKKSKSRDSKDATSSDYGYSSSRGIRKQSGDSASKLRSCSTGCSPRGSPSFFRERCFEY